MVSGAAQSDLCFQDERKSVKFESHNLQFASCSELCFEDSSKFQAYLMYLRKPSVQLSKSAKSPLPTKTITPSVHKQFYKCVACSNGSIVEFIIIEEAMADKKQQQMKEEIAANLAKKDYYEILGIQKNATDAEIKKAYRTLALRFHPDKNQVEGAKQVFKHVSHAYSVLIDPEKKQHYDRYGPETQPLRPQNRQRNAQQDYEFEQYDDIFRMFFGQGPIHNHRGGAQFRTFTYTFGNNFQQGQQGQQMQQRGFNFYYIFLAFFLIYTLAPLFQSKPSYSTIPSNDHRFKTKTSVLQTEFYATQKYFEQVRDPDFKRQSEMVIDREMLTQLQKKCETKKREKKRQEQLAYRQSPGPRRQNFLNQARNVDVSACRKIAELRQQHEDYIRDLTYMR